MSLGLQPTQMEEWKKKHRVRSFIESFIVDSIYVVSYFATSIGGALTKSHNKILKNKKYLLQALLMIAIAILIVI